jgi:K+-transporting ATPase ATPase C chain
MADVSVTPTSAKILTEDRYFWSRPSAVDYNAAGSGGSNKGPGNPDYLATVQARLDTFLAHHPGHTCQSLPPTSSPRPAPGSTRTFHRKAALVQVARIAKVRGFSEEQLRQLVNEHTQGPLLGLFGTSTVNVLELNLALDQLRNE